MDKDARIKELERRNEELETCLAWVRDFIDTLEYKGAFTMAVTREERRELFSQLLDRVVKAVGYREVGQGDE